MNRLELIKQRYEKTYILADESLHKILTPMKDDILYLIDEVEKMQEVYYREHQE